MSMRIRVTQNYKSLQLKNIKFFDQKLQIIYTWASIKIAKATGDAFRPQMRTSST
jgi:hypothetical protein